MRAVAGAPKKHRERHVWRALALAARVVVALVAMQLSGIGHVAIDVFQTEATVDGTDCPNEKPGRDCPPGCPDCHCGHGGVAVPPSALSTTAMPILGEGGFVQGRPCEADTPSEQPLPSIFRPPRRDLRT